MTRRGTVRPPDYEMNQRLSPPEEGSYSECSRSAALKRSNQSFYYPVHRGQQWRQLRQACQRQVHWGRQSRGARRAEPSRPLEALEQSPVRRAEMRASGLRRIPHVLNISPQISSRVGLSFARPAPTYRHLYGIQWPVWQFLYARHLVRLHFLTQREMLFALSIAHGGLGAIRQPSSRP